MQKRNKYEHFKFLAMVWQHTLGVVGNVAYCFVGNLTNRLQNRLWFDKLSSQDDGAFFETQYTYTTILTAFLRTCCTSIRSSDGSTVDDDGSDSGPAKCLDYNYDIYSLAASSDQRHPLQSWSQHLHPLTDSKVTQININYF